MSSTLGQAARARLVRDYPWYGSLSLRLRLEENPNVETARSNGVTLAYNPEWFEKLSDTRKLVVIAKGTLHCALLHFARRGARDVAKWQEACDHAANLILKQSGLDVAPEAPADPSFAGLSAEAIYAKMAQDEQDSENEPGKDDSLGQGTAQAGPSDDFFPQDDPSDAGTVEDAPRNDPSANSGEPKDADESTEGESGKDPEADWKLAVTQASMVGAKAGTLPGGADLVTKEIRTETVDWRTVLREYISVNHDFAWSSPNRRFIHAGMYFPGTMKTKMRALGVFNDTSGSTSRMQPDFIAEINAIFEADARPEKILVIDCDARIHRAYEAEGAIELLPAKGGGGTSFRPPFEYVEKEGIELEAAIYLTDLKGPFPEDPGYPVLWIVPEYCTLTAPFGEVVKMVRER